MQFKRKKEIQDLEIPKKNKHLRTKIALVVFFLALIMLFVGFFAYLVNEYIETHTFKTQAPIIVRTPLIIERLVIESPIATNSALNIAYAQEVANPFDPKSPKGVAWELVKEKWGFVQWGYFEELVQRESSWHIESINSESGSCGLMQFYPCSKLEVPLWDYEGQLKQGIEYISDRYGTPEKAIHFHNENGYY